MSKTRNKNRSELEYLSGELRKLKKENKQLRRLVEKYNPAQDSDESLDTEDTYPKRYTEVNPCLECGKGKLRTFEIIGRFFMECDTCDFRKKIS